MIFHLKVLHHKVEYGVILLTKQVLERKRGLSKAPSHPLLRVRGPVCIVVEYEKSENNSNI